MRLKQKKQDSAYDQHSRYKNLKETLIRITSE